MNNNKGFTLVELLGSMVILGLLMVMVVPNIVGILSKNKEKTYIEDAKKLVEVAKYKISMGKDVKAPYQNGKCVMMGLGYLDNAEFTSPPNGGCYDVTRSFVLVKLNPTTHRYEYYVQLAELFDRKYTGVIPPTLYENLTKEDFHIGENKNLNFSYFTYTQEGTALALTDEVPSNVQNALSSICPSGLQQALGHNGPKTYSTDSRGICAQK